MTPKNQNWLLVLASLLIAANSAFSSEFVPVYLWQTAKSGQNIPALSRVSTDTFGELIQGRLDKDTVFVAFVEPNLSPEDFNTVTQSGEKVFAELPKARDGASTIYLPQVQTPINAVPKLFDGDVTMVPANDFNLDNFKTSALIIDLNDLQDDEDRNHMLARHDKIIVDIYKQLLGKYENVVAIFTGRQASWVIPKEVLSRKIRDTGNGSGNEWIIRHEQILIYASERPTLNGKADSMPTDYKATVTVADNVLTANLVSEANPNNKMEISFSFQSGGYWSMVNLSLTQDGNSYTFTVPRKLFPPSSFSYQCTKQQFATADKNNLLILKNFQIQPFLEKQTELKFGDPYFCVGFTSPAIWSGIFITFILAAIMAIGLMMMMDMKTMDRFDDPKGKTIIINATD